MSRVRQDRLVFDASPTLSLSAYSTSDAVGSLATLNQCTSDSELSGVIESVVVSDADNQSAAMDLVLYQSQVTGGVDNTAYAPDATEIAECIGVIRILSLDYVTIGARSVATVNLEHAFQMDAGRDMFVQLVARDNPSYTASDSLRIKVVILQD